VSRGDQLDTTAVTFEAARAQDWVVIDEPPIKVTAFEPGTIHSGDHAIFVDGHLIFVDEQPDIPGRVIKVLDLRWDAP
jgi:hypothetical protein